MEKIKSQLKNVGAAWQSTIRSLRRYLDDMNVSGFLAEDGRELVISSLTINTLSLAIPLTLMQVYDRIVPNAAYSTLTWFVLACTLAIACETVLRYLRSRVLALMAAKFEHQVGHRIFDTLLRSRIGDFEKEGLGTHLDRLNSVSVLRNYFAGQVFQVLLDIPFVLLFLIFIAYLGGPVVIVPLLLMGGFVMVVAIARTQFSDVRQQQISINDRRFNFVIELLSGIHLIKAQSLEEQMLRRYERLQGTTAQSNMSVGQLGGVPGDVGATFLQLGTFGAVFVGTEMIIAHDLTIGQLAACTLLTGRALQPLMAAAGFWLRFSDADIARRRLNAVFRLSPEVVVDVPALPEDFEGAIDFRDVHFRYDENSPWILAGVDLSIQANELIGLRAHGSSGTTTLTQLLMGTIKPQFGEVLIDSYNIAEWDYTRLQGRIEYLPQQGTLFKGSIIENISLFDPTRHQAAMDASALLGLDEMISLLPHGYETVVDSQASAILPPGLFQRICMARALVIRPRIIIFDETTAALDHDSEEIFTRLIAELKGKATIVLITDRDHQLELADRIFDLGGGLLEEISHQELALNFGGDDRMALTRPASGGAALHPAPDAWQHWVIQTARTWEDMRDIIRPMGIHAIDADHRRMTEIALEACARLDQIDAQLTADETIYQRGALLDEMIACAEGHFRREETLIALYGLPGADHQHIEHEAFVNELKDFANHLREGRITAAFDLRTSVLGWWINHVNAEDTDSFLSHDWRTDILAKACEWDEIAPILYPTGLASLDQGHRRIVDLLLAAPIHADEKSTAASLTALSRELRAFFDAETKLAERFGLDVSADHLSDHQALLDSLENAVSKVGDTGSCDAATRYALLHLWIGHINVHDYNDLSMDMNSQTIFATSKSWDEAQEFILMTGDEALDDGHRELTLALLSLSRVIALYQREGFSNTVLARASTALADITNTAHMYFAEEQNLLEASGWQDLAFYAPMRDDFISRLERVTEDVGAGRTVPSTRLKRLLMREWVRLVNAKRGLDVGQGANEWQVNETARTSVPVDTAALLAATLNYEDDYVAWDIDDRPALDKPGDR